MQIQNYNQYQYKPVFTMKIADPTTYSTTVYDAICEFIGKHEDKFSPDAVIKKIEREGRSFSEKVIDDGGAMIRLGETDEQIAKTLNMIGKYNIKFSSDAVTKEIERKGRYFFETVIDDGGARIRLGETDEQIIKTLNTLGNAFDTSA